MLACGVRGQVMSLLLENGTTLAWSSTLMTRTCLQGPGVGDDHHSL